MTLDLNGYFDRINFRGVAEPTLDALQALVTAHTRTIPFENLDPLMGVPVDDLGPEALTDKLVHRRRGGYCYEQNGLMGYVLSEVGFRVRRLAGRVIWMLPPDAPFPAQTHTVLAVTFPGSAGVISRRRRLRRADTTSPIRIETGSVQQTTHEPYRLEDRRDGLVLQALIRGEWVPLYEFTHADRTGHRSEGRQLVRLDPPVVALRHRPDGRAGHRRRPVEPGRPQPDHPRRRGQREKSCSTTRPPSSTPSTERFGINMADLGERGALEARTVDIRSSTA